MWIFLQELLEKCGSVFVLIAAAVALWTVFDEITLNSNRFYSKKMNAAVLVLKIVCQCDSSPEQE